MTPPNNPLDGERLFVAHWGQRTHVRTTSLAEPEEERESMVAIAYRHDRSEPGPFLRLPVSPASGHQPSVVVRRRWAARVIVALAALGVLLGAGSLAGAGQDAADGDLPPANSEVAPIAVSIHVVQPGDTLWALARRAQPEGDIRPMVARLAAAHGPGPLVPGERLRLAV